MKKFNEIINELQKQEKEDVKKKLLKKFKDGDFKIYDEIIDGNKIIKNVGYLGKGGQVGMKYQVTNNDPMTLKIIYPRHMKKYPFSDENKKEIYKILFK